MGGCNQGDAQPGVAGAEAASALGLFEAGRRPRKAPWSTLKWTFSNHRALCTSGLCVPRACQQEQTQCLACLRQARGRITVVLVLALAAGASSSEHYLRRAYTWLSCVP